MTIISSLTHEAVCERQGRFEYFCQKQRSSLLVWPTFQFPPLFLLWLMDCGFLARPLFVWFEISGNANMVELVLLDQSSAVDHKWTGFIPTGWCNHNYGCTRLWHNFSERLHSAIFWLPSWSIGHLCGSVGQLWLPLLVHLCTFNQVYQLPKTIGIVFSYN